MKGDEFEATFQLMNDGVSGPRKTVMVESTQHARELAFAWSEGELGHPWEVCTISVPELEYEAELSL